uniref:OMP1046 n=1 Tax=Helicobacter acinonychis TaxID=212 RepID=A0A1M4NGF1_HELAC|nr:OMP56 [Helicobacter acinonychis]SFZ70752.1 OMP1046 [Helicobacter acinonychis]SFZ70845.1 OMP1675 [Helicobacter acinonychis]
MKQPFLGTTPNPNDIPFKGNVNLNAEINAIQKNVRNFSTRVQQAQHKRHYLAP